MIMQVGNKKVTKIMVGNHVIYDKEIQDASWIECPDLGGSTDFRAGDYLLLAKYDEIAGTMAIQNSSRFSGTYTSTASNHLVLTLPKGFAFDVGNPTTGSFYDQQSGSNNMLQCPITYTQNQMFASFRMMYSNGGIYTYMPESTSKGIGVFKVKRSDT